MSECSESQRSAATARGVRVGGGRGFLCHQPCVGLCVNERNQLLLWDFYQDCEDLIFYHHIILSSGSLLTREGERPELF